MTNQPPNTADRRRTMQVEMIKKVESKETVEIEVPYYYLHDVGDTGDYHVYGKIEDRRLITITVQGYPERVGFDLEIDARHISTCGEFMSSPYWKSTEAEFLKAKADMLAALQSV